MDRDVSGSEIKHARQVDSNFSNKHWLNAFPQIGKYEYCVWLCSLMVLYIFFTLIRIIICYRAFGLKLNWTELNRIEWNRTELNLNCYFRYYATGERDYSRDASFLQTSGIIIVTRKYWMKIPYVNVLCACAMCHNACKALCQNKQTNISIRNSVETSLIL